MAYISWGWLAAGTMLVLAAASAPVGQASADHVSGSMGTGGPASPPTGHIEFCRRHPRECRIVSRKPPIKLSERVRESLASVNRVVNRVVKPRSDILAHNTKEFWSYPDRGFGDCEDVALQKQRMLHQRGIPLSNLLVTVVSHRKGEGHAVLTVRTDQGDFILDYLNSEVKLWTQTGYRFHKRQSSSSPGRWVAISSGGGNHVASVR
jgi:predicted transglutaminase-like cysteine proteinase